MKKFIPIILISFLFSYQNKIELDSENTYNFLIAEYYFLSNNFSKANEYYSLIQDNINFQSYTLYKSIAESNLEIGKFEIAIDFYLKSYNLNKNNQDLIMLIYNLYIILGDFNNAEFFLIDACTFNKNNYYLLDNLLNHFLSDKKLVESIEILADMFNIKNIEFLDMINKATILYNIFNDITLINNIIDSHYNRFNNINFIKLKFIFSNLSNNFSNLENSYYILENNKEISIEYSVIFCQKLVIINDFQTIHNILAPYYIDNKISLDGLKLFIESNFKLNLKDSLVDISEYGYNNFPNNPISYELFISSLIDNKDYTRASNIITIAKNKFPNYYIFNLFDAKIREINGDYNTAINLYNKILTKNPNLIDAKHSLAKVYNLIGDYKECDNIFLELLEVDFENIIFLNDFAFIIADRITSNEKELIYAIQLIEYGFSIEPNNYQLMDTYGWINYKLGNYEIALEYIRKSLTINKKTVTLKHLVEILKNMKEFDEANKVELQILNDK